MFITVNEMKKGGVGASYKKECDLLSDLKSIEKINVRTYDKDSKRFTFLEYKTEYFCEWLKKHDLGLKVFRNHYELNEEKTKIIELIKTVDPEILYDNTCLVDISNGNSNAHSTKFLLDIVNTNYFVFKNKAGDLYQGLTKPTNSKITFNILKLDYIELFRNVYGMCFDMLLALHSKRICYSDFKLANVLVQAEENGHYNITLGDLGSLVFPWSDNDILRVRNYTFVSPVESNFVNYWLKENKNLSFVKKFKDTFGEKSIKQTLDEWNKIISVIDYENSEIEEVLAFAIDWFHFGIFMISFISKANEEELFKYVPHIWKCFCSRPCIYDENYNIDVLDALSKETVEINSTATNSSNVAQTRQTRSQVKTV